MEEDETPQSNQPSMLQNMMAMMIQMQAQMNHMQKAIDRLGGVKLPSETLIDEKVTLPITKNNNRGMPLFVKKKPSIRGEEEDGSILDKINHE